MTMKIVMPMTNPSLVKFCDLDPFEAFLDEAGQLSIKLYPTEANNTVTFRDDGESEPDMFTHNTEEHSLVTPVKVTMTVRYPQQDSTDLEEPAELTNAERCLADNGLQWDAIRCYRDRVNCEYEQAVSMVRAYVDNVVGHQ